MSYSLLSTKNPPYLQLGDLWEYLECKPASTAYDCQAGLTRSHIEAWRRLAKSGEPAAWIFEYETLSKQHAPEFPLT